MSQTVSERVMDIVGNIFTLPEGANYKTKFDSLGVDSLDLMELVNELEIEFGIQLGDNDAQKIAKGTIGGAISFIEEMVNS